MDQRKLQQHVIIFPLPFQGPINSMFKLAELLCLSGLHITFIVTEYNYLRLLQSANTETVIKRYNQRFQLKPIPDGLLPDQSIAGPKVVEVFLSLKSKLEPIFRDMLAEGDSLQGPDVTCIIADGIWGFPCDVGREIGVPVFAARTVSPCFLWAVFCLPRLIEAGEFPFQDDDLDVMIKSVPGTEDFLRRRDLPSSYRLRDLADPNIHVMWLDQQETRRFDGLILNSFEELEESILPHLRTLCPNIYTIGPLHAHLKNKLPKETTMQTVSSPSLWKEDRSCLNWLDEQETKSVIYVSFGSVSTMTKDKLLEIWYGLVNSGMKFLWVIRPGLIGINGDWSSQIPVELSKGTKQRGCIVDWAPQEEVLEHEAVGGFLTHSGWNSTLESICAGVPMISWPFAADQQINSRFVTEVWKIGLDMKDTCNRAVVEKMVKELMVERRDEFSKRVASLAESAANSSGNLDRLIKDIKSWHLGSSMYLNGNIIYNNL